MPVGERAVLTAFACTVGDVERRPEDVPGFAERWADISPTTGFAAMGAGTFRAMSGPVLDYVVDCVKRVLAGGGLSPDRVDGLVLATSDGTVERLGPDFAVRVLAALGLTRCVPSMLTYQQCCSSLSALAHAARTLDGDATRHVVLVALDTTADDLDRLRTFGVFGDAVAGCLVSRGERPGGVELLGSAVDVDFSGMVGADSFRSRQQVGRAVLDRVLGGAGVGVGDLDRVFPANLFVPLATFNATAVGLPRPLLHFPEVMRRYGHCGNADWLINLVDHVERDGVRAGALYLAQSSAPGFAAAALLRGR